MCFSHFLPTLVAEAQFFIRIVCNFVFNCFFISFLLVDLAPHFQQDFYVSVACFMVCVFSMVCTCALLGRRCAVLSHLIRVQTVSNRAAIQFSVKVCVHTAYRNKIACCSLAMECIVHAVMAPAVADRTLIITRVGFLL